MQLGGYRDLQARHIREGGSDWLSKKYIGLVGLVIERILVGLIQRNGRGLRLRRLGRRDCRVRNED